MIIQCQSQSDWLEKLSTELSQSLTPGSKVYLPAGNTPKPLYKLWRENPPPYLSHCEFYQIDEVLDGKYPFANFFKQELPQLNINNDFTTYHQADVALLGLGMNGHVGFHEPGIPKQFYCGCVPLSKKTHEQLDLPQGTWGITYGLGAFMNCKKVFLMVRGEAKQEILKRVLAEDHGLPATTLLTHPNFKIFNMVEASTV